MKPRKERMAAVILLLTGATLATFFGLKSCENLKTYFYDPTQVVAGEVEQGTEFRLGGMVKEGTVTKETGTLNMTFVVTDFAKDVTVRYSGLVPDLFRDGQGVVATGKLNSKGEFEAHNILAKHDENYMPPEVADSLKYQQTDNGTQKP